MSQENRALSTKDAPAKRAGPFFVIPSINDLTYWLDMGTGQSLYATKKILKSEKQVLESILELSPSDWETPISSDQIMPLLIRKNPKLSPVTLKQRISKVAAKLTKLKVFTRHQKRIGGNRLQYCYEINDPNQALEKLESELSRQIAEKKNDSPKGVTELRNKQRALKASLMKRDDIIRPVQHLTRSNQVWSQLLISQLISKASRETLRDKRNMIETKVVLGDSAVDVVAYTTTRADNDIGGMPGLMAASDAQIFLAVITLISQLIDQAVSENRQLINRIPIDVVEIVKLLGLPDTGANRATVVKALHRMIYTGYTLKFPPGLQTQGLAAMLDVDHNVSELDLTIFRDPVVGIEGEDEKNRRWFTVSLNSYIWKMVCSGALTKMVHPRLLKEKDGNIHKLHAHFKLFCPSGETIKRDTNDLLQILAYKGGPTRFKLALRKLLLHAGGLPENTRIPEEGVEIDFFGYRVSIYDDPQTRNGTLIEITADDEESKRAEEEQLLIEARAKHSSNQLLLL